MMRNGNVYAFITDKLGSVTNLIDASGATQASYAYDPYGSQVSATGGEDLFNLLGFTGALADPVPDESAPATGYTHLGNRWQNPATGTFTQQDSLNKLADPASANTYAYAADNPTNNIDPTGQWSWPSALLGAVVGYFSATICYFVSAAAAPETVGASLGLTVVCGVLPSLIISGFTG
jgi:RHS repeat-associated protein